jgi:hypothetical protein
MSIIISILCSILTKLLTIGTSSEKLGKKAYKISSKHGSVIKFFGKYFIATIYVIVTLLVYFNTFTIAIGLAYP